MCRCAIDSRRVGSAGGTQEYEVEGGRGKGVGLYTCACKPSAWEANTIVVQSAELATFKSDTEPYAPQ